MSIAATEQVDEYQSLILAFQDALGILITDQQRASVLVKLSHVMQSRKLASVRELANKMLQPEECPLNSDILEAITVAEPAWFKYPHISHLLHHYVLDNITRNAATKSARIWVAGCGDGSLAYSVAMDIAEYQRGNGRQDPIEVIATDVSGDAIKRAQDGVYSRLQLTGLSGNLRTSYMVKQDHVPADVLLESGLSDEHWAVSDKIRDLVSFKHCDLMDDFSDIGEVDVIICPELLVYFSNSHRSELLEKLSAQLVSGGIFLTSEDQPVLSSALERVDHPAGLFYRQKS